MQTLACCDAVWCTEQNVPMPEENSNGSLDENIVIVLFVLLLKKIAIDGLNPTYLLLWRRANAQNVSQHTLYGVQHIHINLTLIHCTFYRHADADQN